MRTGTIFSAPSVTAPPIAIAAAPPSPPLDRATAMDAAVAGVLPNAQPPDPATADAAMRQALEQIEPSLDHAAAPSPPHPSAPSSSGPPAWTSPIQPLNDRLAPVQLSGFYQMAAGFTADEVILKRADGRLNERDFRIPFGNLHENTFDPRLFSRFRLLVDTRRAEGVNVHANITVDPWSFRGRSQRITVVGSTWNDRAEIEYKFWSNTGYTVNDTFPTLRDGDTIGVPEVKLTEGRTPPTTVTSSFGNVYTIPAVEVEQYFQPLREFWVDYTTDQLKIRFFPLALSDQAVTSDDPLHLSNHHLYWEPSPWIDRWVPGRINSGAAPDDFTPGAWSDAEAYAIRDSDGVRLTALRGLTMAWDPSAQTQVTGAIAAPLGLWDHYGRWDAWEGMARLTQAFGERVTLGGLYTTKWAYDERRLDAYNHVFGLDATLTPTDFLMATAQIATSRTQENLASANYNLPKRGHALHAAVTVRLPVGDGEGTRLRAAFTHMDEGFDPGLASYHQTRRDQFWSRHLHFRRPFAAYRGFREGSALHYERDVAPFRIGDGIDIGRDTWGLRLDGSYFHDRYQPLIDLRNVHDVNGKLIETVVRHEATLVLHPQWTAKYLFLRHQLPKTTGGIDPFLSTSTGAPFLNAAIVDGRDPSLTTYSAGLEFRPEEWLSLYGIVEETNDTTEATGNYPRGLLNSSSVIVRSQEDRLFRDPLPFLYNQGFFPLPPYPYVSVYRAGVTFRPYEALEINAEWTRNEFAYAGQIDDNINHWGLEAVWQPARQHLLIAKYTRSFLVDIGQNTSGAGRHVRAHHNLFVEWSHQLNRSCDLTVQFGEAAIEAPLATTTFSPFGGFLPTLDTEHLVRVFLTGKF